MAGLTRTQFMEQCDEARRRATSFAMLRDAFDGTGGFASLPPTQEVSDSGAAASIPDWASTSYLLKHEGENWKQYEQRRLVARYVNHVRRGLQHWIGLLVRRAPTRKGTEHPSIEQFLTDCDGRGTSWDAMREKAVTQAALFGGQSWTVDRADDVGARNASENKGKPRFRMREPGTFYDWRLDSTTQRFQWLKIVEQLNEKAGPTEKAVDYLRATVWYPDSVELWTMPKLGATPPGREKPPVKHNLGRVPAGVLTFGDTVGELLFGWGPGQELADLALQDFQDLSRLTESLEKTVFNMFLVPIEEGDKEEVQQIDVGSTTAYGFPKDSSHKPEWCEPGPNATNAHMERRAVTSAEGLKILGLEQLLQSTQAPTSGLARQYEFQHLDASLSRVGARVDLWEREVLWTWLRWTGESPERADAILAEYVVEQPDSYDIRDKDAILNQAMTTLALPGLDPWTQKATLQLVSDSVVSLTVEEKEKRDEWLDAQAEAMTIGETHEENEGPADADADTDSSDAPSGGAAQSGSGDAGVLLAASDKASVITVNEVRRRMGLTDLMVPAGGRDPDGNLTVTDFVAKRDALRDAQKQATVEGGEANTLQDK